MEYETLEEIQSDPSIQIKVEEEMKKMEDYHKRVLERVYQLKIIHEEIVIIQKLDVRSLKSFLYFAERAVSDQIRTSYVGIVVGISGVNSGDEIKEYKKKLLKKGDVVSFNPDSCYSLNITIPEDMDDIWILSIENILLIDEGFNIGKVKRKTLEVTAMIEKIKQAQLSKQLEKAHQQQKEKSIKLASK